jgi:Cu/Ag efflux protein CusF
LPTKDVTMKLLHACLLAALLPASSLLPAQPTSSSGAVVTGPGTASTVRTVKATATVVGIVPETRTVSLKRPDGKIVEIEAGDDVRNFDKIKVGDTVTVEYTEALSLQLEKGGSSTPHVTESQDVTRAPPGAQPRGSVGRRISVLADVVAVDARNQMVSLRGPQGNLVELKVPDPEQLKRIKKGDQVRAVYTEALAVAVVPAPAPAKAGK